MNLVNWRGSLKNKFVFSEHKVLANEDTLLLMFLVLRKLGNICCGHKMFLNKISNNVSATMCPCLPGPIVSRALQPQDGRIQCSVDRNLEIFFLISHIDFLFIFGQCGDYE